VNVQLSLAAQRREQIKASANLIDSTPAYRRATAQQAHPLFVRASFLLLNAGGEYEANFMTLLGLPRA
jgi:hypothetical protein